MGRSQRVLLVEDNEEDALLLLRDLKRCGHAVTSQRVQTAEAFRAALPAQSWDIVISDYSLPGFTGLDALAMLQASGLDLPFILVSGTVGEATVVRAMKAGAQDDAGRPQYMIGVLLDITERVRAEAQIRQSAVRSEALASMSQVLFEAGLNVQALGLRDKETEGHPLRVTEGTLSLARAMGLAGEASAQIRPGALLHDIVKMGIPDAILLKPGPLTDEEWVVMRKHPVYAYELLSPIAYLKLQL